MKIYIIRHGKVNMKWPQKCNSKEYDAACMIYDRSDINKINFNKVNFNRINPNKINETKFNMPYDNIYVSSMKRSIRTAQALFPTSRYHIVSSIREVPLKSFADTNSVLPLWIWNIFGRVQWFFNSKRQDEKRTDTILRATKFITQLENNNEDCILVTHGFFIKTFIQVLRKKGYKISGNRMLGFSYLNVVWAEK